MAALSGAAVGAAVGGIAGGLIGLGMPEFEAKRYEGKLEELIIRSMLYTAYRFHWTSIGNGLSLALLGLVSIPRCTLDADPFMGAHGYLLCPSVCSGCTGPFRIHTVWQRNGAEVSTGGAQYFCRASDNHVESMSDAELALHMGSSDATSSSSRPAQQRS